VITCLGGPLDGCAVEAHDLPELGEATMEFCTDLTQKQVHHVYRCMMHPGHYGVIAYVYEGIKE
jgi:hypothetical protein